MRFVGGVPGPPWSVFKLGTPNTNLKEAFEILQGLFEIFWGCSKAPRGGSRGLGTLPNNLIEAFESLKGLFAILSGVPQAPLNTPNNLKEASRNLKGLFEIFF